MLGHGSWGTGPRAGLLSSGRDTTTIPRVALPLPSTLRTVACMRTTLWQPYVRQPLQVFLYSCNNRDNHGLALPCPFLRTHPQAGMAFSQCFQYNVTANSADSYCTTTLDVSQRAPPVCLMPCTAAEAPARAMAEPPPSRRRRALLTGVWLVAYPPPPPHGLCCCLCSLTRMARSPSLGLSLTTR